MTASFTDRNISSITEVIGPAELKRQLPRAADSEQCVAHSREAVTDVLYGRSGKLLVIVGPCPIHDPVAALEYAARLLVQRISLHEDLEIVMRVYFEKPRTTIGWKGLVNDPHLDDSHAMEEGLRLARQLMLDITSVGLPIATEFLDLTTPHYLADLVTWGAIGARTTESQIHRELASSLACPIGFKNGTDGNVNIAIDAIQAARHAHCYLGITESGHFAKVATTGNREGHLVLRGGKRPNYDAASVAAACTLLNQKGLPERLVIDASHGNSGKLPENQLRVCDDLCERIANNDEHIAGVMIESNLVEGRQSFGAGAVFTYGQSVTDACIGWSDTEALLRRLANASRQGQLRKGANEQNQAKGRLQVAD
ncbi:MULTISPECIES: 3-deoxy-7-phosphoheptulonate synthase [unclassified Caballeronia]|uniref:3-deoxy-7-phosphoheptulonate synthase n=1 Tax=unclassified Caballeronia TaxID=2646786 RepID=UPI002864DA9B|nr:MULTISPECIES: 3-deoxy-7-phosphoheptulonate synthase [unclassified Caballeronia]MDR5752621.1 3-deoxy-7-phosphoheptulonate synthase [Caballeronia sp. LZ024]MDR5841620.1 3-deoxy-7-phosphoheptulonate synthase [Caballeronia sp. LZ031]